MEFGLKEEKEAIFVADLDIWLTSVYQYWYQRGFGTMVVSSLVHVAILAFTILLSTILFAFVDWGAVYNCKDEESCNALGSYFRSATYLLDPTRYGRDILTLTYIGVFGIYWLWSCVTAWCSIREAWEISRFYQVELNISGRELHTLHWNEIVTRLGQLQKSGRAPWKTFQIAGGAAERKF